MTPLSKLKDTILSSTVPTATMLIGASGSGKSTWFKESGLTVDIISTDDILDALAFEHGISYSEMFGKVSFKDIQSQMMMNLKQAVEANRSFIVDRTNMSRKVRNRIMSYFPSHYLRYAAVFIVERDELNKRLIERAKKTGKIIPADVVDDMLNRYEPPTTDEFDEIFK